MKKYVVFNYKIPGYGQFPNYKLDNLPLAEYTFLYGVSINSKYFEDDWVLGYINFAKSVGFRKVSVLIADTVHRHNLAYECPDIDANELASRQGRIWREKYEPLFRQELGNEVEFPRDSPE